VPVVVGHRGNGLVDGDAGVVDQNVESPVLVDGLADRPAAIARRADIAPMGRRRCAVRPRLLRQLGDELLGSVPVAVVADGYGCALIGEAVGDAAPMPRVPRVTKATRPASLSVAGGFDRRGSDSNTLVMIGPSVLS
jgi:hypothetical protein